MMAVLIGLESHCSELFPHCLGVCAFGRPSVRCCGCISTKTLRRCTQSYHAYLLQSLIIIHCCLLVFIQLFFYYAITLNLPRDHQRPAESTKAMGHGSTWTSASTIRHDWLTLPEAISPTSALPCPESVHHIMRCVFIYPSFRAACILLVTQYFRKGHVPP
ncbi:hypothetical protein BKA70DRAFT_551029 [Coprinopsis sp. MPI-PUGE-AT-0042]|nr:hypothetical protein BKA70DRAFT_551029 [Coprinopsis sp. MPI-PUGE-AT-0042]